MQIFDNSLNYVYALFILIFSLYSEYSYCDSNISDNIVIQYGDLIKTMVNEDLSLLKKMDKKFEQSQLQHSMSIYDVTMSQVIADTHLLDL